MLSLLYCTANKTFVPLSSFPGDIMLENTVWNKSLLVPLPTRHEEIWATHGELSPCILCAIKCYFIAQSLNRVPLSLTFGIFKISIWNSDVLTLALEYDKRLSLNITLLFTISSWGCKNLEPSPNRSFMDYLHFAIQQGSSYLSAYLHDSGGV